MLVEEKVDEQDEHLVMEVCLAGSHLWQQAPARGLAATPDLAGFFGGRLADDRC
ncbi:MAG: hypothetical protein AB1673_08665 [Actinomycetota bacterium]